MVVRPISTSRKPSGRPPVGPYQIPKMDSMAMLIVPRSHLLPVPSRLTHRVKVFRKVWLLDIQESMLFLLPRPLHRQLLLSRSALAAQPVCPQMRNPPPRCRGQLSIGAVHLLQANIQQTHRPDWRACSPDYHTLPLLQVRAHQLLRYINGTNHIAGPNAPSGVTQRNVSGRGWQNAPGTLSSPLSGPVLTGDDDDLFSFDG